MKASLDDLQHPQPILLAHDHTSFGVSGTPCFPVSGDFFGAQLLANWPQPIRVSAVGLCRAWSLRRTAALARRLAPPASQAAPPLGTLQRAAALVFIRFGARPLLAFGILRSALAPLIDSLHTVCCTQVPNSALPDNYSLRAR